MGCGAVVQLEDLVAKVKNPQDIIPFIFDFLQDLVLPLLADSNFKVSPSLLSVLFAGVGAICDVRRESLTCRSHRCRLPP